MRLHTSPTSYYALKKFVSSFKLCRIVNKQFPSQNKFSKEQCNKKTNSPNGYHYVHINTTRAPISF